MRFESGGGVGGAEGPKETEKMTSKRKTRRLRAENAVRKRESSCVAEKWH